MANWEHCKSMAKPNQSSVAKSFATSPTNKLTKTRRAFKRKYKVQNKSNSSVLLSLVGTNCGGLNLKRESFFQLVNKFQPSIITLQETKLCRVGTLKLQGYQVFETTREERNGGGLLTAALLSLEPVLITSDVENEILTIQISVTSHKIRIINGYGPQEDENKSKIVNFWNKIETEVIDAKNEGCLIIIEMDANAKVGKNIIQNDPNSMTDNGRKMLDIVNRNGLFIANSSDKCSGTITRIRKTSNAIEQSAIDYIILCERMRELLNWMNIDEDRSNVLKHVIKKKKGEKLITSDHNVLTASFNIKVAKHTKLMRHEFYDFKNKTSKLKFLYECNTTTKLSSCFANSKDFKASCHSFFRQFKKSIHKCFNKIRVLKKTRPHGNQNIQKLLKVLSYLKNNENKYSCSRSQSMVKKLISKIEDKMSQLQSESNFTTVTKYLHTISSEDGLNHTGFWKVRKKLCPRKEEPPMAKRDTSGNLICGSEALKMLYVDTYKERLKHREIEPKFLDVYLLKTELWRQRLETVTNIKSDPWSLNNLERVLVDLKKNKAMDPNGMKNELFKEGCIGVDLKIALLFLFNGIKENQSIPKFLKLSNITSIYKNKGSKTDLENDRGIFILPILKKILDKLIYNGNYTSIDRFMSDSNIGARQARNIRDHLFIVYSVVNSVIKGNADSVDIQAYDIKKCFDALWLDDCLNDIYDALPKEKRNDQLALLYRSNESNLVSIKTPVGYTQRTNFPLIVQQGGTWGSLLCANSIDVIGRECRDTGALTYKYKDVTEVLPLSFIDDLAGISKCGDNSIKLNIFINTKIELKKLQFHTDKCVTMHVGKNCSNCPTPRVHGHKMSKVSEIKYLGDIISSDGKNSKNIKERVSKGYGAVNQIMNILQTLNFGNYTVEMALLLRNSIFINGILTNSEVWFGLNEKDVSKLENLDGYLLTKVLQVPRTVPEVALYLELGVLPIAAIIKGRRLNYLHSIIKSPKDGMLYRVFITQWLYPCAGDWTEQVRRDLSDLGLGCSIQWLESKSKWSFKKIIKRTLTEFTLRQLLKKKDLSKKMSNLYYTELKTQTYLVDRTLSFEEKKTIFRYRTRMSNFRMNFKGDKQSLLCPLCKIHFDDQNFVLRCPTIRKQICEPDADISDIYSETISLKSVKLLSKALDIRNNSTDQLEHS